MRFRKMSLKWHPDKNMQRQKEAGDVFTAVHGAYHFLTTNNFDYKRWAAAFVIPPMQSLEDVLLMALKGASVPRMLTRVHAQAAHTRAAGIVGRSAAASASTETRAHLRASI